ncbi:DNA repair protein RecN [Hahella sp. CCB-MM4]|uniref:DNA repair protein RecN n=1 Tax=Hahella sp. (strain CCB-MM4) TaxID=1926491 RepID=UPI000B9AF026|nr:DNA repair protein RecN [Hahella sp. CCB-MM4]OZG71687.1 DNA repair protein RecN [Hahella sp. CCB-MM4]
MLTHLSIRNLAIAAHLELEFGPGMTAMSGETGAGKSIVLDALGLTLGDRSSSDVVRHGSDRADVTAVFDLANLPDAQKWLKERELDQENECIIRRTVTAEGRSRGYINGQAVPMQDLKDLGERLMEIHSQHEHHSLLKRETQQRLVDEFGNLSGLVKEVSGKYKEWKQKSDKLNALLNLNEENEARIQLLTYQVEELDSLALQEGELDQLEQEQNQLANAESILASVHQVSDGVLEQEGGCLDQLRHAVHILQDLGLNNTRLNSAQTMVNDALIQLEEAHTELRHLQDDIELDPERLQEVEVRLSSIYDLARKHRITTEQLPERHQELASELTELTSDDNNAEALSAQVQKLHESYLETAEKLSKQRGKTAKRLQDSVVKQLANLGMTPEFVIELTPLQEPGPQGAEEAEMLISMNAGQPPKPLRKIASGGELSRISLAIQVVTAASSQTPTMVFDEVDVGIGGATAEIVGRMLRELGQNAQILCVTHLAQVASQANHHLFVTKSVREGATQSSIHKLSGEDRVHEIARMLGGVNITEHSLAHAHEMLNTSQLQ